MLRRFFAKSQKVLEKAKIIKGNIISVIEIAKIFQKVFPSKQTIKMSTNLETPKRIPEVNIQN